MMAVRLKLEHFDPLEDEQSSLVPISSTKLEQERLAAFERGYAAGWEDAVSANEADASKVSADLAHTLQDLDFSRTEMSQHLLRSFETLVHGMVDVLLPGLRAEALAVLTLRELQSHAAEAADKPVELRVSTGDKAVVQYLLEHAESPAVTVIDDRLLGAGQAILQCSPAEIEIDLAEALESMRAAVGDFFMLAKEDSEYG